MIVTRGQVKARITSLSDSGQTRNNSSIEFLAELAHQNLFIEALREALLTLEKEEKKRTEWFYDRLNAVAVFPQSLCVKSIEFQVSFEVPPRATRLIKWGINAQYSPTARCPRMSSVKTMLRAEHSLVERTSSYSLVRSSKSDFHMCLMQYYDHVSART